MSPTQQISFLNNIYSGLAETLASPGTFGLPSWMSASGKEWPFFNEVTRLAAITGSQAWAQAVVALSEVPSSALSTRQNEYEQLFVGLTHPPIWLYESHYVDGRMLGPTTFALSALYTQIGLEVEGAELPDHAALELSFLAFIARQESMTIDVAQATEWAAIRKLFINNHAGTWLPEVGQVLARSHYPAWIAIGLLLVASLSEQKTAPQLKTTSLALPQIEYVDQCILCGFCVQVCPTHALAIHEDQQTTSLWLSSPLCVHCNKCMRVCPEHVIQMGEENLPSHLILLYESPRGICPKCAELTFSQAEIKAVADKIGNPSWVEYCLNCRSIA
ncbi:MAG: molecular chaperone TorD family protein [Anaerolineales bacterium]|nr:molecular chaperone TorD family protein [Anaerolineales bacterium]